MSTFPPPAGFQLPADNWYQISSMGEFKHSPTGLTQIIDPDSCQCMITKFDQESSSPNFPGILIDFDHFSLDQDKPTEAAGWIVKLDQRPTGLWAQIRWSDTGEQAVRGGRYRFISPVFRQDECVDLGNSRVRPVRLVNAAVTNDPNITGLMPLSNSAKAPEGFQGAPSALPLEQATPPPAPAAPPQLLLNTTDRRGFTNCIANVARMPTPILNRAPVSEKQRKYLHWLLGGGGYGNSAVGLAMSSAAPALTADAFAAAKSGAITTPESSRPPPDYGSKEDFDARIKLLSEKKESLLLNAPVEPQRRSFERIDTRALRDSLLRQKLDFASINRQVAAAEAHNQSVQKAISAVKKDIRKRTPNTKRRKALLAAWFDKQEAVYQKDKGRYDRAMDRLNGEILDLDSQMQLVELRKQEDQENIKRKTAAWQLAQEYSQKERKSRQRERDALKAYDTMETLADYASSIAQEQTSPEAQLKRDKENQRARKRLWNEAARGDRASVNITLREMGVDPATVDIERMVKEAGKLGITKRDASWQERQRAQNEKATAWQRALPKPLSPEQLETDDMVDRARQEYKDMKNNEPQYAREVADIKTQYDKGNMNDWMRDKALAEAAARRDRRMAA